MGISILLMDCAVGFKHKKIQPFVSSLGDWPLKYQTNNDQIHTFKANARFTIESASYSGHLSLKTYWIQSDTLFLQAEGPLGLDVGKIFVGKSRFILYNQFNNNFVSGSIDNPFLSKFFQTNLSLRELKQSILGRPPFPSAKIRLIDPINGIFSVNLGLNEYKYYVNPVTGLLEKWENIENGQVLVREQFKKYKEIDGIFIPGFIQIYLPLENERVSISYKDIELNNPIKNSIYTIEIGPKIKQLNLN
jgi:hypothetical protein